MLVEPTAKYQPDLLTVKATPAGAAMSMYLEGLRKIEGVVTMPGTAPLSINPAQGFKADTWLTSDTTGSWNELETTNFIDDSAMLNTGAGERAEPFPTVVALSREAKGKTQKILVTGDADWISNAELGAQRYEMKAFNFNLILAAFYWLSDNEVPIDMTRIEPIDTTTRTGEGFWSLQQDPAQVGIPIGIARIQFVTVDQKKR